MLYGGGEKSDTLQLSNISQAKLLSENETLVRLTGNETLLALYKNITRMIEILRLKELEASEVHFQ